MQHSKEALEGEALRLLNVHRTAYGLPTVATFDGFTEQEVEAWKAVAYAAHDMENAGREYKLEIVNNRIDVAHLRIRSPYNGEIIFSGETLASPAGAKEIAEKFARNARRGFNVIEVFEGPTKDEK